MLKKQASLKISTGISRYQGLHSNQIIFHVINWFIHQVIKSVHKARNPEEHESRKTSIVHSTIDWSKYPPSAYRKRSQVRPPMQVDQDDGSVDQSEREGNCSEK